MSHTHPISILLFHFFVDVTWNIIFVGGDELVVRRECHPHMRGLKVIAFNLSHTDDAGKSFILHFSLPPPDDVINHRKSTFAWRS